jgi:hypothetical protein
MADDRDQPYAVLQPVEGTPVVLKDWEKAIRRIVKTEIRRSLPAAVEKATRGVGHDDEEIAGLIHLLAARSNDAKDEVLRKALTLYGLALDAREKGNKVVILDSDDCIIHDVIGFESMIETLGSRND